MGFIATLKQIFAGNQRAGGDDSRRRKDPPFGGLKDKDVADLPPERAAEMAGHAPERVDT